MPVVRDHVTKAICNYIGMKILISILPGVIVVVTGLGGGLGINRGRFELPKSDEEFNRRFKVDSSSFGS